MANFSPEKLNFRISYFRIARGVVEKALMTE